MRRKTCDKDCGIWYFALSGLTEMMIPVQPGPLALVDLWHPFGAAPTTTMPRIRRQESSGLSAQGPVRKIGTP